MFKYCPDHVVNNFIKLNNLRFGHKLTRYYNFSRVVCLADFDSILKEKNLKYFSNTAVVSGSIREPELLLINYDRLDVLNYKASSDSYNLDNDWSKMHQDVKDKYNLVICSQVFEHIFSPLAGIKNLSYITQNGGYIWISIPTINCIHGEPFFYSSGYHPRYLYRLANEVGLDILHIGAWGNIRYLNSAVLGKWLTADNLKPSFSKISEIFKNHTFIDGRSNSLRDDCITDTWALLKKIKI